MLTSVKKIFEKGFDISVDFMKTHLSTAAERPVTPVRPSRRSLDGGLFVYYTMERAHEDISVFFPSTVEVDAEDVFVLPPGRETVGDVISLFPVNIGGHFKIFRFKVEDDLFGYIWKEIDNGTFIVPRWRDCIVMRVLVCPIVVGPNVAAVPGAPPIPCRSDLIQARQVREAAQVQAAREFAQTNALNESKLRQSKLELQNSLGRVLDNWCFSEPGKYKDIRSLLSSISTVLWNNSGWVDVPIGELMLNETVVKRTYRKAIIMCHPDRHQQGSAEQQFRADRVFNALNESWKVFDYKKY